MRTGIVRARTALRLRAWDIPRSQKALEAFNAETGKLEFPGIYILFAGSKVYVGEAKSVYQRLKTHMSAPEEKIKEWTKAVVINDGRPASQSDFNDTVVRKSLEAHLIRLLKANKYHIVAQGETQTLNPHQKNLVDLLTPELDYFLKRKNIVSKMLEERGQEEVFGDDLRRILERSGRTINKWGAYEAVVDGSKVFIRPGSKKSKGWQITFRGRKSGSFIDSFKKGNGSLLVPRDGVLFIPLSEVQKVVHEPHAYDQDTIDIWIVFGEEKATLSYKDAVIDVTGFRLVQST